MAFMRHNNNGRRHNNNHSNNRHRHNNNQGGQQNGQNGQRRHVNRINQVFESNGPDGRIRGTAQQIVEKYMTLARDASSSNDKVLSMNYYQHAEHYQRLLNEILEENAVFEREREAQRAAQQASQPEISGEDADAGFVENAVSGDEQPREQRELRQERRFDRGPRPQRSEQRSEQPRQERRERPQSDSNDDLETLPSFLQVPITTAAPEAAAEAKPRVARPRRAAAASAETSEE